MEVTDQKRRISEKKISLFYKGFRRFERESKYRILSPGRLSVPPRRQRQNVNETALISDVRRFLRRVLYRKTAIMSTYILTRNENQFPQKGSALSIFQGQYRFFSDST